MTDDYDPFASEKNAAPSAKLTTIDLEFETVRRFREDMAPYLNYNGCFVRSKKPLPHNTEVHFRFLLPEGFVLAQGNAVVTWIIEPEANPELVPGMALRFTSLDQQAKEVIDELVDFHIATGGDPFDLGPGASEAGEIPTDSLAGSGVDLSMAADTPTVPMPQAEPEPSPPDPKKDEVLPSWLSDVAKEGPFDVTLEDEDPPEETPVVESSSPGDLSPLLEELEIKLVDDPDPPEEPPEEPPARPSVKSAVNIPKKGGRQEKPPRDIRLGLLVAAAIVLVAVAALVWSVIKGSSGDSDSSEVPVVVEEIQPADDSTQAPPVPETVLPEKAIVLEEPPAETPIPKPVRDRPATRIVDIVATARGDRTNVVIRGDGVFLDDSLRVSLLKEPARLWLRIRNIETFYRPNEFEVGSPQVLRVRIGHHPEESPPSLWVVLDLADESVVMVDRQVEGDSIRVSVGRR